MVMDIKTTAEMLALFQRYGVLRARLGPDGSAEFEFTSNPPSLYPQPVADPYVPLRASDTPEEPEPADTQPMVQTKPTGRRLLDGVTPDDPLFDGVRP